MWFLQSATKIAEILCPNFPKRTLGGVSALSFLHHQFRWSGRPIPRSGSIEEDGQRSHCTSSSLLGLFFHCNARYVETEPMSRLEEPGPAETHRNKLGDVGSLYTGFQWPNTTPTPNCVSNKPLKKMNSLQRHRPTRSVRRIYEV